MEKIKSKSKANSQILPQGNTRDRDEKGRFIPKSALGAFNEKLNKGNKTNYSPSSKAASKLDDMSNIVDPKMLSSLLRTEGKLEDQIPLIV